MEMFRSMLNFSLPSFFVALCRTENIYQSFGSFGGCHIELVGLDGCWYLLPSVCGKGYLMCIVVSS